MLSEWTTTLCRASFASFPPPKPLQPSVTAPAAWAASTAARMLGELPLPLMAISRSPGRSQVRT